MMIDQNMLDRMVNLAKSYGAKRLILFGSVLENPETARDLDLACDIEGWKFFEFGTILEEEFPIPVDVIPLTPPNRFTRYIESKGKRLF